MKHIILITGGQRSGKSRYAQQVALKEAERPVYLATSRPWDDEHRRRIARHQQDRGEEWITIEEDKHIGKHQLPGQVVVVDCVTLWATNFFFDSQSDVDASLAGLKEEFAKFTAPDACYIFITNEIGWGGTSTDDLQRRFTDLQGWINQFIASEADEVVCMVSGIPMKIK
ncbi:MAG: bifunctional adenosylcobinamide kinase/adenosylcobinamide-phosphate guanylyltransferase [Tannerellaceae bacterium]|jgi:adenosylcobinamide kinase/adenosylcobinamide-phosphate guanylyltransferase|nr:bifunctional adenosylcobinamide kinase/adenosylcobinamide-phosphate guanylyltransferase [Tannerellaceae bacterium]